MITQKDVAKKAGVSSATVSAVINKNKFVSPDLREKVERVIKNLNYEVNSVARSLKNRRTNTIGVIIGNVLSSFYSIIASSIERSAKKYGFSIILCNGDDDPVEELNYLKVLKSNMVDGIILTPTGVNSGYINQLINTGTNLVLIDRLVKGVNCDAVLVDNVNGSYTAVRHFIENGYKKIALIDGFIDRTTGRDRMNGYLKALYESGIKKVDSLIKIGTFKKESGMELCKELLTGKNIPEAIFTANIDITLGAIKTIKDMGLRIPQDVAIIGFDDSDWSAITDPPLSCVSQPASTLGAIALEMLINKIKSIERVRKKPEIIILDTNLIIRNSSNFIRKEL